jgi:hypothetical protein
MKKGKKRGGAKGGIEDDDENEDDYDMRGLKLPCNLPITRLV